MCGSVVGQGGGGGGLAAFRYDRAKPSRTERGPGRVASVGTVSARSHAKSSVMGQWHNATDE